MALPGGGTLPLDVTGGIPKANAAAAIGRFARKALPVLGTGVALYELGQELGFTLDNSSGTLVVTEHGEQNPNACYSAPCFNYRTGGVIYGQQLAPACNAFVAASNAAQTTYTYNNISTSAPATCSYDMRTRSGNSFVQRNTVVFERLSATPTPPPAPQPSTIQALEDKIASESGWPSSSALSRATVDAIRSGESLVTTPTAVTGPASTPGTQRQTVNPTQNTTTTTTTTHNHTYSGPNVTTTTTTTTTTINNTTNEVVNEETTTEEPALPEEQDGCEANPNVLGCAQMDTPEEEIPKEERTITYEQESHFGGGSCPQNVVMTLASTGQSVTVWDWQRACQQIGGPFKAVFLVCCALAALMILAPGVKEA